MLLNLNPRKWILTILLPTNEPQNARMWLTNISKMLNFLSCHLIYIPGYAVTHYASHLLVNAYFFRIFQEIQNKIMYEEYAFLNSCKRNIT